MRAKFLVAQLIVAAGIAALATAGCTAGTRQAGDGHTYAGDNFNPTHESSSEAACSDLSPCP